MATREAVSGDATHQSRVANQSPPGFLSRTIHFWNRQDGTSNDVREKSITRPRRPESSTSEETDGKRREKWTMGMLTDRETDEVPGSVLLLSKVSEYNEPLGLRNAPARTSASSLPSPYPHSFTDRRSHSQSSGRPRVQRRTSAPQVKRTADGAIVLNPQPDDSLNDPLNWARWRRDASLVCLGFYCMVGGGMTPILAAGFNEVARDLNVSVPQVALTTGLYMLGLGLGSVILSPTAILLGKRPVYLVAALCFILTAVWCALSPDFASLVVARIFMGLAVSSVECLPSASVAEIFFLHEKAYRLGIYTLLLLGGKNLVPLVSAAIIESLHWRWVFWIVAIIVGFAWCLLFLFVPESFWDRTPRPHRAIRSNSMRRSSKSLNPVMSREAPPVDDRPMQASPKHAHFADVESQMAHVQNEKSDGDATESRIVAEAIHAGKPAPSDGTRLSPVARSRWTPTTSGESRGPDYFDFAPASEACHAQSPSIGTAPAFPTEVNDAPAQNAYTDYYLSQPPKTYIQQLKPWTGRLSHDSWFRVAVRPFILFAYPSILWSTLIYSLSVGWLIVLSESVSTIYEHRNTYNFTPLQAGLVYVSPFVGGILGTAVAGKISDTVVKALARRNGGIYEPEFRLVMAIPIALSTTIGLMGYGWSAHERDSWIVPTIFFGIISFGCALGSTTSITFAVDSYRQYAGEALVTLNFSKNILHGLVFSLFFNKWLDADGSKTVFIAIGGIQLACLLTTIPMYIYGKRARMWTVRRNLMEKF